MKKFFAGAKDKLKIGLGAVGLFLFGWAGFWGYGEHQEYEKVIRVYDRPIKNACFVGDTGLNNEAQSAVINKMKKTGCWDVFVLGDLVYPNGLTDERDINFVSKYGPLLQFNSHPVLGNHERYQRRQTEIWTNLAKQHNFFFPHHYWGTIYEDVCVLGFEGSVYNTLIEGDVEQVQNNFIQNFLSDSRCEGKLKITVAHQPYKSSGEHGDAKGRLADMYEKIIVGRVNYSFGGHDHNLSYEGEINGTAFIVSGSGAKLRNCREDIRPTSKCWKSHGFVKVYKVTGTIFAHDFVRVSP